jgi:CubicO group peptidase (beta-lactamase class C family)
MDSGMLAGMFDYIEQQRVQVHSVLVVRNGYVVMEAYYYPYNSSRVHPLLSCSKSFLSALIGIAIDEGYLNLEDKALDFFPDRTIANDSLRKQAITVEHLLRMMSGLDWPESSASYSSSNNILWQMMDSPDWAQFVLDRPMAVAPGTTFNYSTGDSQLLGAILEKATGTSTEEFARTRLFEPLGVPSNRWYWESSPEGVAFGGGGLNLTPRDMAKFGTLYLEGGVWEGEQVVPADWVEASVTPSHYGYQWWRLANGGYAALGYGGQLIAVVPDLELVAIITGDFSGTASAYLVDGFIVPAARSAEPLPENPTALAQLNARIDEAASPAR